jgi:hypothetical protein
MGTILVVGRFTQFTLIAKKPRLWLQKPLVFFNFKIPETHRAASPHPYIIYRGFLGIQSKEK